MLTLAEIADCAGFEATRLHVWISRGCYPFEIPRARAGATSRYGLEESEDILRFSILLDILGTKRAKDSWPDTRFGSSVRVKVGRASAIVDFQPALGILYDRYSQRAAA